MRSSLKYWSGADLPGAELEVDGVEVDPAHAGAQLVVVADLLQRIGAVERLDRRRIQRFVEIVVGGAVVVDDVAVARNGDRAAAAG